MAAAIRARCRWARWWRRCARLCEHGYREVVLTGVDITELRREPAGRAQARRAGEADPQARAGARAAAALLDRFGRGRSATCSTRFASEPRLMPHLHLSLQAGDDLILKRMKRRHLRADAIAFCEQVRRLRPDVVFGADIIAGFPTETEDDVRPLARSRRRMRADASARLSVLAAARARRRRACRSSHRAIVKERARRLRDKGAAALRAHLDAQVGAHAQRVLIELQRHRPHRAFHAGAARRVGRAGDRSSTSPSPATTDGSCSRRDRDVVSIRTIGTIDMTADLSRDHLVTSIDAARAALRRALRSVAGQGRPTASPRLTAPSSRRRRSLRWRRAARTGSTARRAAMRRASCGSHDEKTLLIPDRRGNNRIDTLAQHPRTTRASRCCF